ncbi:MAG: DUF433 domain-containing protein [Acidobacteriaceae bacterium]|nr:DUF433 domain-containing protein [Acidobacteriaceae bacterium]
MFRGTCVPSRNRFNYLSKGHSIDEFLLDFPTVMRDQVMSILESAMTS